MSGVSSTAQHSRELPVKTKAWKSVKQPTPFTPGIMKAMVLQHAYTLYRDKLPDPLLTLEDWVLAEKDLMPQLELELAES